MKEKKLMLLEIEILVPDDKKMLGVINRENFITCLCTLLK